MICIFSHTEAEVAKASSRAKAPAKAETKAPAKAETKATAAAKPKARHSKQDAVTWTNLCKILHARN